MSARYYVWSRRGEVYHDSWKLRFPWNGAEFNTGFSVCGTWLAQSLFKGICTVPKGPRPPANRRPCLRCRKLREKGARG